MRFGGSLADFEASELAGVVMKESVVRSGVDPQQITYVTVGNCIRPTPVIPTSPGSLPSRPGCRWTPWPWQVNRLCASGLQGIVTTAQNILLGDAATTVSAVVWKSCPRLAMLPALRSGARMGDTKRHRLHGRRADDPSASVTWASRPRIWRPSTESPVKSRDAFAVESQRRAAAAIDAGHFKSQIVPDRQADPQGREVVFDTDEHTSSRARPWKPWPR